MELLQRHGWQPWDWQQLSQLLVRSRWPRQVDRRARVPLQAARPAMTSGSSPGTTTGSSSGAVNSGVSTGAGSAAAGANGAVNPSGNPALNPPGRIMPNGQITPPAGR